MNFNVVNNLDNNNLITIGSHTHSHANLVRESFESVQNEMLYSKNLLEEKLNQLEKEARRRVGMETSN